MHFLRVLNTFICVTNREVSSILIDPQCADSASALYDLQRNHECHKIETETLAESNSFLYLSS